MDIQGGAQRDAAPINLQASGDSWICNDNECGPWIAGASATLNCAGINGCGVSSSSWHGEIMFNHIHDIQGLSDLQNHGIYLGGVNGNGGAFNAATQYFDVKYNWVHDCTGGSNIQLYWQHGVNSNYLNNIVIENNWCENAAKYNINVNDSTISGTVRNNICLGAGANALVIKGPPGQTMAVVFEYNTVYGFNAGANPGGTGCYAIMNDGYVDAGTVKFAHNIFVGIERTTTVDSWYVNNTANSDTLITADQNKYYDFKNSIASGWSKDSNAIFSDPQFTNRTASDFTRQAGADVTTTELVTTTNDFYGIDRPQGAHKWIGACEGVGT
jgi:hypothetical protein